MLLTAFRRSVAETPDAVAILVPDGDQLTYRELSHEVDRVLGWFRANGIGPGKTVATWLDNSVAYAALILATAGSGAVHVPISRTATSGHIAWLLERTRPALVIGPEPLPVGDVPVVSPAAVADGDPRIGSEPGIEHAGLFRLLETSGSTGKPRLVAWTQEDLLQDRLQWIDYTATTAADTVFNRHTLDVAHGCDVHLFPALLSGARLVLADPGAPPATLLRWLEQTRATVHSGLPRHYEQLVEAAGGGTAGLPSLRLPLCGGAYLSERVVDDAAKILGVHIRRIYGSTEFGIVLGNMEDALQTERGMSPVTGVEVDLVPIDPALPGIGEIVARSPHTSTGYAGDEAATAAAFDGGWYRTGDVASHRGEYRILGRVADLLRGARGPVFAPQLEASLVATCQVTEAVVLAPLAGDDRTGAVVVASASAGAAEAEVVAEIQRVLDEAGVEAGIRLTADIPHTAVGKPDKPAIRAGLTE